MKKLMAFGFALMTAAAMADMKIAVVDMFELVRKHPNYESNKSFLTESEKDHQKKLESMKKSIDEIQKEGEKKAAEMENPMLSQSAKKKLEKEIMEIQQKYIRSQQNLRSEAIRLQQDLQEMEGRFLKTTTEDIRKHIAAFAEKNAFDLIVDKSAVTFSKKDMDVTAKIVELFSSKASKNESK
jgi:Skp family chaperone for outer membrane proteins